MQKNEFRQLFAEVLQEAAAHAEECLGRVVTRDFEIELHGAGYSGVRLSPEEAFEQLFIGEDRFFRVIDVAVIEVKPAKTVVFVCVSGHAPSAFEETWNQPEGFGPFKQIQAKQIRILDNQ